MGNSNEKLEGERLLVEPVLSLFESRLNILLLRLLDDGIAHVKMHIGQRWC